MREEDTLDTSSKAGEYFIRRLKGKVDKEVFEIAFLSAKNKVIATKTLFVGTINESPVYPREIIKEALNHDANSVMIAHNHPGGSLQPSRADIEATKRISVALKTVSIKLLDHIIVADNKYMSFAEKGFIEL